MTACRYLHNTSRRLKYNSDTRICKYDKGNGSTILNSNNDFKKVDYNIFRKKIVELSPTHDPKQHQQSKLSDPFSTKLTDSLSRMLISININQAYHPDVDRAPFMDQQKQRFTQQLQYDHRNFKKLLGFATTGEIIIYRDRLFKRVDGVAMGSPLGPTLQTSSQYIKTRNGKNMTIPLQLIGGSR